MGRRRSFQAFVFSSIVASVGNCSDDDNDDDNDDDDDDDDDDDVHISCANRRECLEL